MIVRGSELAIDFPWSLWRLIGLQDRSYCIDRIELFDTDKVLWKLRLRQEPDTWRNCKDVRMPIVLGRSLEGFSPEGVFRLQEGVRYGIGIEGIGNGRADFILKGGNSLINITDPEELMTEPCGSFWGPLCPEDQERAT